jgi:hypothetical protein
MFSLVWGGIYLITGGGCHLTFSWHGRPILTHGNRRYGHYKDSVFRSIIKRCKHVFPAAACGTSTNSNVIPCRQPFSTA